MYKLTHATGQVIEMPWRHAKGRSYSGTLCSFLYNLNRATRADWTLTKEDGTSINLIKAINAAAKEMNAIRHGDRIPVEPTF